MKSIEASFTVEELDLTSGMEMLTAIERAGRTCYKSEKKITAQSNRDFVKKIIDMGHHSVLEHEKVTVRVICDRGVTHEIVRHRIASYSQESTRYCNYAKDDELTFIRPCFWKDGDPHLEVWRNACKVAESSYLTMVNMGASPQEARSVLPNSLKTEIVMTMNLREWRHFFTLRAINKRAHPQMREIAMPMLAEFKRLIPVVFDDIC